MRMRHLAGAWMLALCSAVAVGAAGLDLPVIEAVKLGDHAVLRAALAARVNVNAAEADGTTALHWAVRSDDREAVTLLIRAGANVNVKNRYGIAPLNIAAAVGDAEVIKALLEASADPKAATSPDGETVLMTAARTGNVDTLRAILAAGGVDVDAKEDWYGETALIWAAGQGHTRAVQVLAEHGANVNARSAVFSKSERGAAFSTVIRGGFTPLLFAAREGAVDVVQVLIERGAELNLGDPDGVTPLMEAIINAHYDLAAFMIDKGANVNQVDAVGRGPLFAAVDMHTIEWTPNRPAPKPSGDLDSVGMVKLLLDRGANVNAQLSGQAPVRKGDSYPDPVLIAGATPFLRAAKGADHVLLPLLLAKGADPNLETKNHTTALMAASGVYWRDASSRAPESDAAEVIKICLARGADVNAANDEGKTPLHGAAARGSNAIAQLLVDHGANLFAKNGKGHTPLDEAVVGGNYSNGATGERHPEQPQTAALLRQLMSSAATKTTAP